MSKRGYFRAVRVEFTQRVAASEAAPLGPISLSHRLAAESRDWKRRVVYRYHDTALTPALSGCCCRPGRWPRHTRLWTRSRCARSYHPVRSGQSCDAVTVERRRDLLQLPNALVALQNTRQAVRRTIPLPAAAHTIGRAPLACGQWSPPPLPMYPHIPEGGDISPRGAEGRLQVQRGGAASERVRHATVQE